MKNYSFNQIIEQVKKMDLTENPIRVKESNTQKRLKTFIDQFYKNKKSVYINK